MVGMVVMVGVMGRMVGQQAIVLLVVMGLVFREEVHVVMLKAMESLKPMGLPVLRLGMVVMLRKQGRPSNSEWRRLSTFQPSSPS
ncbi:hypothetical protein AMTR_s00122p00042350 [Amborella trichopoda]|uniref:Uncharacterized protein n=1 Tax=Amborella trichopoda TaxID=13333 RepID=W1NN70_AMBTC|nr:hypothetical protein AMTR_s00122p00042350 [Amborella trichopoda]